MYAHLRIVRPTAHLGVIAKMYCDGLGFEVIASFENHDHFDGVVIGHPTLDYQLEFTHERGQRVGRAPTQEDLLVFYVLDAGVWVERCQRMAQSGFTEVPSYNPYWEKRGKTFEDIDGYRVVLEQERWPTFKA